MQANYATIFEAVFRTLVDAERGPKRQAIFDTVSAAVFEAAFRPLVEVELDTKRPATGLFTVR
jgi:hypothetical protein